MVSTSNEKDPRQFDGLLIIDKPTGMTSHDVVSRLRRILHTKKIGHTGTLDPFATGVLVMLVGKGTRLARYLDKDEKSYRATVRFGFETNTGDRDGTRTRESELPSKTELVERITRVIPAFTGLIEQIPPMYSAKKIDGQKLYELAREGIEVDRKPVSVTINRLTVEDHEELGADEIILSVSASAGTYIRTIAEDIGRKIGLACHLSELRRTRAGRFDIQNAVTIEELENLAAENMASGAAVSMVNAVSHLPGRELNENEVELLSHGMRIGAGHLSGTEQPVRLTFQKDQLIGIGAVLGDEIQPKLVLNAK